MPTLPIGPLTGTERREECYRRRVSAAANWRTAPVPANQNNGDEDRYANKAGNFTKGLPHNALGEVDLGAYNAMLSALGSGSPAAYAAIPLGCGLNSRPFVNPQAGLAFDTEGYDSAQLELGPAPAFASDEIGAEIVENYWMAVLRDVHFEDYPGSPDAMAAAAELDGLLDFRGPRDATGHVTTGTLFRGLTPGDLVGPYLSQFLTLPVPFGAQGYEQRMKTILPGKDFMTTFAEFLAVQNGCARDFAAGDFDTYFPHIRNGRDLSQWVHIDVLFQGYFNACLILLAGGAPLTPVGGGIGGKLNPGNPYRFVLNQTGFGTFGGPGIITALCEVATRALKAVWHQKWNVHRRLRPEAYAGFVHQVLVDPMLAGRFPVNGQALGSAAIGRLGTQGLLPMAFPEGSPLHPAYGAGHATVAGACVTILKAFFDETQVIANPMRVDAGGNLAAYAGPALTVGGELNKLASNVAIGRNIAGVHWRSDATASLRLGEKIAIGVLRDHKLMYNEAFGGYTFTDFSGAVVTV